MVKARPLALASVLVALAMASCAQSALHEPPPASAVAELVWTGVDVGDVRVPGSFEVAGDDGVRVLAAGSNIGNAADAFHFVYVPLEGDVDVRGQIAAVDRPDAWAKAGVMVRGSLDAGAPHALMAVSPTGAAEFISRSVAGGDSTSAVRNAAGLESWVRVARTGATAIAFTSPDGETWNEVGRADVAYDETVYVGVAVTSKRPNQLAAAEVRGLEIGEEDGVVIAPPGAPDPGPDPAPAPEPEPDPEPIPSPTPTLVETWVCPTTPLSPQHAPTLYVASNGSDGNDGRSVDRPLRTLREAAERVVPGDVVWVRGGTYPSNVEFTRSGTARAPIVFESYPGECAVIDGSDQSGFDRVAFSGVEHMVFRNFEVRDSPGEGIYLSGSSFVTIAHVRVHGSYYSGITNVGGRENLFTYVIAHDNVDTRSGGDADGISISSGDRHRIDRCVVYANSDDGVDTWRSTHTVVERCVAFGNGRLGGDGNGFKMGGASARVNTVVRHSVAFGNRANGFDYNSGRNVRFDQNTAFDNGRHGFNANADVLRNNLAFGNRAGDWASADYDNTEVTNSWNLGVGASAVESTDPSSPSFLALRSGGPAVNVGTPIDLPYAGSAPDLGALPLGETLASYLFVALGADGRP